MKRKNFEIIRNGIYLETKHAWNSSCRAIEKNIGVVANDENTTYSLRDTNSTKVGFYFETGYRVWTGDNGNVVKYEINLLG